MTAPFKSPDGAWAFRADLGPRPDGSRNRRYRSGFATKKAAADALVALLSDASKGLVVATNATTVGEFLHSWLSSVEDSLRPSTYANYADACRIWIIPRIGGRKLRDLTPPMLQSLYNDLSRNGRQGGGALAPRTVKLAHTVLRRSLDQAVSWRLLAVNPADVRFSLPRHDPKPVDVWSADEAQRFLASARDHRLCALWALCLSTGLRRGEALGLRWASVNLAARRLSVVESIVSVNGRATVSGVKTRAGVRLVDISDDAVASLMEHQARQAIEEVQAGTAWADTGYVFTTPLGAAIHPQNIRHTFRAAAVRAGVPPLTPKGMRHTAATLALSAGVHPKKVQEMLGHSDISMTLDIYSHVIQGMHRDAADAIGRVLFPQPKEG